MFFARVSFHRRPLVFATLAVHDLFHKSFRLNQQFSRYGSSAHQHQYKHQYYHGRRGFCRGGHHWACERPYGSSPRLYNHQWHIYRPSLRLQLAGVTSGYVQGRCSFKRLFHCSPCLESPPIVAVLVAMLKVCPVHPRSDVRIPTFDFGLCAETGIFSPLPLPLSPSLS